MKIFTITISIALSIEFFVEASKSLMSPNGQALMAGKLNYWREKRESGDLPMPGLSASFLPQKCNNTGDADGVVLVNGEAFPCKDVDFLSFIPVKDLFIDIQNGTTQSSDIWGWEDTETNKEYTLFLVDNGIWFIDTTDPSSPVKVAFGPNPASKFPWGDVKVYRDVAYVVMDRGFEFEFDRTYGVEVFDLARLRDIPEKDFPVEMKPDTVHSGHGKAHNIAVNTETGYAYSIGSNKCRAGAYILNLEPDPLNPVFVGCVDDDGYTHDAQIVLYDGPDERFIGKEILFAYNEDTLTIYDVSDKQNIKRISRTGYPTAKYTHQGWLTGDMRWIFLNDEFDEKEGVVNTTTTYIVDVSDLRKPVFGANYTHRDVSSDHNLYDWGAIHAKGWGGSPPYEEGNYSFPPISNRFMYLSNYAAGIRILDIQGTPKVSEAGFFDIAPDKVTNEFVGTWSNYMHPSGNLAVSSIERGFFMLRPRDRILYTELEYTISPTIVPTAPTVSIAPTMLPTSSPFVCEDEVPTGLILRATGEPALCSDLVSYCNDPIIQKTCPASCKLCVSPTMLPTSSPFVCEDEVPTGVILTSNAEPALCSEIVELCSDDIIKQRCPVSCGLCIPPTSKPTDSPTNAVNDRVGNMGSSEESDDTLQDGLLVGIFVVVVVILMLLVQLVWNSYHVPAVKESALMDEGKKNEEAKVIVTDEKADI
eukprot:snap_masked-scaffold_35-processed-gene-2.7-mRNA-1 protein AED:1.00 eAED:1.00 QI:0/-1/0/0/-1/1/1/0/701